MLRVLGQVRNCFMKYCKTILKCSIENYITCYFRYTYDPYLQSLNDNPENELHVAAGDYILVWGQADEVGFI